VTGRPSNEGKWPVDGKEPRRHVPEWQGALIRLRSLAVIETIRRAEDLAWGERLERQQVVARLGRVSGRAEDPLQAMLVHADTLKQQLRYRERPGV
jgi:hypothetical protein